MRKSFTLIELIVVIGIVALISGLGVSTYNGFQQSTRDQRRKNDLETITGALNAYYAAHKRYPDPNTASDPGTDCLAGNFCHVKSTAGNQWIPALVTGGFLEQVPVDPINKLPNPPGANPGPWINNVHIYTYGNVSSNGQEYDLTARLENTNDPDRSAVKNYKMGFGATYYWNSFPDGSQIYELSPGS